MKISDYRRLLLIRRSAVSIGNQSRKKAPLPSPESPHKTDVVDTAISTVVGTLKVSGYWWAESCTDWGRAQADEIRTLVVLTDGPQMSDPSYPPALLCRPTQLAYNLPGP
ncbi:hypothetical protein P154DRAFT_532380 [Amniculicola lignicola CBS 123094]|uniref:Uncharacterized protein n=1 Tax=Amniculicola lignicola CBS 123094 TaxID=1392246 RepID=A0A6A5WR65_9PLEO|nr:hypothetical protein P154DRAFT_532380 [Amniculicola lignicola CBS 123094]